MRPLLLIGLLLALVVSSPVRAGYHGFDADDVVQIDVLPGWRTETGTHIVAIRMRLAEGWKTYWRAPGDAGIPPRFDWSRSKNLKSVRFVWPTPIVFEDNGMTSVGYKNQLVLPVELTPKDQDRGIALRADMEIGVCEEVCIPVAVRLRANLIGAGAPDQTIAAALKAGPDTKAEAKVKTARCKIDPTSKGLRVTAELHFPALGPDEHVVFELPDQEIWISEAQSARQGNILSAVSDMIPPNRQPFSLDRSTVRMTVLGGGRAVDIQGCSGG